MEKAENNEDLVNDNRELSIKKLTKIKGIASPTAEAMYDIGIQSYADLVEYLKKHTTKEISEALKEKGVNRGPGLVDKEKWIEQAEELSGEKEKITPKSHEESAQNEQLEKAASGRGSREYDFTVSFDFKERNGERILITTVYHDRNGGDEKEFEGSDHSQWVNWILERAQLPTVDEVTTPEVDAPEESPPIMTEETLVTAEKKLYNVTLEIRDVKLSPIEPTTKLPEKRIKAEIDFSLSGEDAEELTLQNTPYITEIYTIDRDNGFPKKVASGEDITRSRHFNYTDQLEFKMPTVGRYELHSVVRLLPPSEKMAYKRGPKMKVIP